MEKKIAELQKLAAEATKQIEVMSARSQTDAASDIPEDACQWSDGDFQSARMTLIDNARTLLQSTLGPTEYIKDEVPITIQFNSALSVISHHNIAAHVPEQSSIPMTTLATDLAIDPDRLTRVLRCVTAHNIFREDPPGSIRHTAYSLPLRQTGPAAWLGHHMEEMLPASAKLVDFLETYPHAQTAKETAMSLAFPPYDVPKGYWDVLEAKGPAAVQRFSDGLEFATATGGNHDFRALVEVFDWQQFGDCLLVDVGGSSGRVCVEIARLAPEMRFVVQDLPELETAAREAIPVELTERVEFRAHDFFEPQPVGDAKVYLMRQILHDWPDAEAVLILKALVPALKTGDTVLLLEAVLPEPGILPPHVERLVRSADVLMMAKHNSKERTLGMWRELLKEADERFVLEAVTVNERCPEAGSLIEVRWVGE